MAVVGASPVVFVSGVKISFTVGSGELTDVVSGVCSIVATGSGIFVSSSCDPASQSGRSSFVVFDVGVSAAGVGSGEL